MRDVMSVSAKSKVRVAAALSAACCTAFLVLATDHAAAQNTAIPPLMLPFGSGWSGGIGGRTLAPPESYLPADYLNSPEQIQAAIARGVPVDKVKAYLQIRESNQLLPPERGIGPIADDPEHPFFNNGMREIGKPSTVRIAGLDSEAARNLKPWALEVVKTQNALALAGKNVEARHARCWELGVPGILEVPQPLYFIQTRDEVVMYNGWRVRHVYMNVPHSNNPPLTWYGESIGRYEGDTLVVDTIGQNDKSAVDAYRTPHTTKIHVVERYRVINGGKGLDTSFTVDDPDTFYKPWGGRRPRFLLPNRPLNDMDQICAAGNEDHFDLGLDPVPQEATPDF